MKNVTIALGEKTLREARRIAAERSTTLNALIREGAILAAAEVLRAPVVYTGDLNHGQAYGGVRAVNPFING